MIRDDHGDRLIVCDLARDNIDDRRQAILIDNDLNPPSRQPPTQSIFRRATSVAAIPLR